MTIRAGDTVEIKSRAEIFATLDGRGALDGLPFMPEMLAFCGQRFVVGKVAHKTCDTINASGGRRMLHALHLKGLRCNGSAHGGCQAACLIFWKTEWVRKVRHGAAERARARGHTLLPACDGAVVQRNTRREEVEGEPRYSCQATELLNATRPLSWWEPTQYLRDVLSRNNSLLVTARTLFLAGIRIFIRTGVAFRALVAIHDGIARATGGRVYVEPKGPFAMSAQTPSTDLRLKAGDVVRVRPYAEIQKTLNVMGLNRGLTFDAEMVPHCGRTYRVRTVVEQIIDEKTGRMVKMKGGCIMLEGLVCRSEYIRGRLLCPRAVFPYWRPIWLEPRPPAELGESRDQAMPSR